MAIFLSRKKNSGSSALIQNTKAVTAETGNILVTPDTGYSAMAEVLVRPTPSEAKNNVEGSLTSDVNVAPSSGKLLSNVIVKKPVHTGTVSSVGQNDLNNEFKLDLGEYHNKRYISFDGWSRTSQPVQTVLWSNPDIEAVFPAKTVTLSNYLNLYDYITIDFWDEVSGSSWTVTTDVYAFEENGVYIGAKAIGNNRYYRLFSVDMNDGYNKLKISAAYQEGTASTANSAIIPDRIVGIKY